MINFMKNEDLHNLQYNSLNGKDYDVHEASFSSDRSLISSRHDNLNELKSKINRLLNKTIDVGLFSHEVKHLDEFGTINFEQTSKMCSWKTIIRKKELEKYKNFGNYLHSIESTIERFENSAGAVEELLVSLDEKLYKLKAQTSPIIQEIAEIRRQEEQLTAKKQVCLNVISKFVIPEAAEKIISNVQSPINIQFFQAINSIRKVQDNIRAVSGAKKEIINNICFLQESLIKIHELSDPTFYNVFISTYALLKNMCATQPKTKQCDPICNTKSISNRRTDYSISGCKEHPYTYVEDKLMYLPKALHILKKRNVYFSSCVKELSRQRGNLIEQCFCAALSEGYGEKIEKPIDIHSHDSVKYVSYILLCIRDLCLAEREFFVSVFLLKYYQEEIPHQSEIRNEDKSDDIFSFYYLLNFIPSSYTLKKNETHSDRESSRKCIDIQGRKMFNILTINQQSEILAAFDNVLGYLIPLFEKRVLYAIKNCIDIACLYKMCYLLKYFAFLLDEELILIKEDNNVKAGIMNSENVNETEHNKAKLLIEHENKAKLQIVASCKRLMKNCYEILIKKFEEKITRFSRLPTSSVYTHDCSTPPFISEIIYILKKIFEVSDSRRNCMIASHIDINICESKWTIQQLKNTEKIIEDDDEEKSVWQIIHICINMMINFCRTRGIAYYFSEIEKSTYLINCFSSILDELNKYNLTYPTVVVLSSLIESELCKFVKELVQLIFFSFNFIETLNINNYLNQSNNDLLNILKYGISGTTHTHSNKCTTVSKHELCNVCKSTIEINNDSNLSNSNINTTNDLHNKLLSQLDPCELSVCFSKFYEYIFRQNSIGEMKEIERIECSDLRSDARNRVSHSILQAYEYLYNSVKSFYLPQHTPDEISVFLHL